ncbi:hypothetical protein LEP1GSC170_4731, partial [Leptospira interrogans serovar Bataviae str. HAI135]
FPLAGKLRNKIGYSELSFLFLFIQIGNTKTMKLRRFSGLSFIRFFRNQRRI